MIIFATLKLIVKKLFFLLFLLSSLPIYASENEFQKGYDLAKQGKYLEAFKVWKPLAEKGNDLAQYSLGVMYRDSLGIEQNYKLAEKWTRLSAEQGNPTAAFNLAHIYVLGLGVEKDFTEAMKWYDLASLDFKKIDIIIEKVRNIRSSDLVCENKKLLWVYTDGDLRRSIENGVKLTTKISYLKFPNPLSIKTLINFSPDH